MKKKQIIQKPLIRAADMKSAGYTRFQIPALLRSGKLSHISRGLYYWTNVPLSSHSSIASVGMLVPHSIICLLSALRFHEIGTQNPGSVWVAIPSNYRVPKLSDIPITAVHYGGIFSKIGIITVEIDGVSVKMTNPVRTVIDCFRFRNKVGLDAALEALEESVRSKLFTADEIVSMAQKCRIYRVMKPYLEVVYR
jgi:predicted transcriptional regulator of viral defense system